MSSLMMVVLYRGGFKFKTNLHLIRGSPINFVQNFSRPVIIGCLTLSLKREEELVHQERSQLIESVVRKLWGVLDGMRNCFEFCKSDDKIRHCANRKGQDKTSGHIQASGFDVDALRKNRFYALLYKG